MALFPELVRIQVSEKKGTISSKSEIKKADKSRSRAYRPKFPLNALKKNYYIFGEEILNTLLPKVPNYKHISSGQKRKCSVSPIEDELPDECL